MKRRLMLMTTLVVILAFPFIFNQPQVRAGPAWDLVYVADTLPENAGFTAITTGCTFRDISLVGAPYGVYHYISTTAGTCYQSANGWSASSSTGFTVEAIVKVNTFTGTFPLGGIAIWATSPSSEAILVIGNDVIREYLSGHQASVPTRDAFHTYRILVQGTSYEIYYDGTLKLTGTTTALNRNVMYFGDYSGGADGDALWDCVAYTTSGNYEPSALSTPASCSAKIVDIDIKPGSYPNSINLGENGLLPVAILGSSTLDVTQINPATINIGGVSLASRGSAKAPKLAFSLEDVAGPGGTGPDGYLDLVAFFSVQLLVTEGILSPSTTGLTLTASLTDGTPIQGIDTVNIVPP
jgi:hypothetical protein